MLTSLTLVVALTVAAADDNEPLQRELGKRFMTSATAYQELQTFFAARQRPGPERFVDEAGWTAEAKRLRQELLDKVFLQGAVKEWAQEPMRVEEAGPPLIGQWHRVRRFRLEIIPGMWTSMWLHEPLLEPRGKVPVVLSFIGHVSGGDATAEVHQQRAIHLARQGLYVVTVEWFGNGENDAWAFTHMALNHIDLWGTHGVGLMFLLMERGLDFALNLPHADPKRVAATGLSGGGWQAMVLAALDERVTLAAPVAGFTGFATSSRVHADLGDSEQAPPGLHEIADYTEIAALVAPRPMLLTYNQPESCCFRADRVVPLLRTALEPIYALSGHSEALRFHVNTNPGTHNYEADNRRAFYEMLVANGFVGEGDFALVEEDLALDIRTPEQLLVGMPAENMTLMGVAATLGRLRTERPALPDAATFPAWQQARRRDLEDLLGKTPMPSAVWREGRRASPGDFELRSHLVTVGPFTAPVVVVTSATAEPTKGTVILLGDEGRAELTDEVASLARQRQVVVIELLHFGDRKHRFAEPHYAMLFSSIGETSLRFQTAELAAVIEHFKASGPIELRAIGRRSSFIALVAAARGPGVTTLNASSLVGDFATLTTARARSTIYKQPEIFVFGIAARFTIEELLAMALPTALDVNLVGRGVDEDALEDLADDIDAPEPELH